MDNDFSDLNSNSSDEILFALAQNFGGMANVIFPKLECGYFSEDDEKIISMYYRNLARMQKNIIELLNERGAI